MFGCEAGIRFPAVKLLDFAAHEVMLEASNNLFAQVVLAHLKARETHGDPASRCDWKIRLVRNLLERGFTPKDVRELFRVIDWLMELPPPLATVFRQEIEKFKRRNVCPTLRVLNALGSAGECAGASRSFCKYASVRRGLS